MGASPSEMIRYILGSLEGDLFEDGHWSPIWKSCPLCSLNFTVYAKLENSMEDSFAYVRHILKGNNTAYGSHTAGYHEGASEESKKKYNNFVTAYDFWSQVGIDLIKRLYKEETFKLDFDMFEYNVGDYLRNIGMETEINF